MLDLGPRPQPLDPAPTRVPIMPSKFPIRKLPRSHNLGDDYERFQKFKKGESFVDKTLADMQRKKLARMGLTVK